MRILSYYKPKVQNAHPPSAEHMAEMNKFMQEMTAKGHYISGGGFLPPSATYSVSLSNGEYTVRENAGSAASEGFGGFGLIQANSQEEMMDVIKQFLKVAGDGECLVRPLMDGPPPPQK
jgi:hypothetical protein